MVAAVSAEPPPLPLAPSSKRILPAFVLCCLFSAHRIYVGRYATGAVQVAGAVATYFSLKAALGGLLAQLTAGPISIDTLEQMSDWEQSHPVPWIPVLAGIAMGIWIAVDAARLVAGKFRDEQGRPITRWI